MMTTVSGLKDRLLRLWAMDRADGAPSLKALAIRGSVWTMAGYGTGQVLRLASNVILARLLFPEAFGLMALVAVFMQGLQMFSDIGIRPSIIQNERGDDPDFLNTAWTMQVVRGFVLWVIACIGAIPVAHFYGEPHLMWLLPASGVSALISGFTSTGVATANRHIRLGKLALLDLSGQFASIAVMVTWALIWPTVWALVAGGLTGATVKVALSHKCFAAGNKFYVDRRSCRDLVAFGKWIFLATVLTYLAMQGDRLILGKLLSMDALGVYSIAFMISRIPRDVVGRLSSTIIFPAVARRAALPRAELGSRLRRHRWPLLVGMAFVTALLVGIGDQVVLLLWDARYAEAAWMLPVLALGLWPRILDQSSSGALLAIGKPQYNPVGSAGRLLVIVLALPSAYLYAGMPGAVIVIAVADVPNYVAHFIGLRLNGLGQAWQDVIATSIFAGFLFAAIGFRMVLGISFPTPI